MKNNISRITIALAALIITMAGFASAASAQSVATVAQSQQANVPTAYNIRASNEKSPVMSFDEVRSITQGSVREIVGQQLGSVTAAQIASQLEGKFDLLTSGQSVSFSQSVSSAAAHSVTEQHTVQVIVKYESRPIGGILTVKVQLVPLFNGIGAASRPIALKTVSTSVENLEEDALGGIISDLTHQLGAEYAAK